jgi:hypothetical protein
MGHNLPRRDLAGKVAAGARGKLPQASPAFEKNPRFFNPSLRLPTAIFRIHEHFPSSAAFSNEDNSLSIRALRSRSGTRFVVRRQCPPMRRASGHFGTAIAMANDY